MLICGIIWSGAGGRVKRAARSRLKAHSSKASGTGARARGRSKLGHTLKLELHALSSAALTLTNPLLPLHGHPGFPF